MQRQVRRPQQPEPSACTKKLRHYTYQCITLNLNDGAKVNDGKFVDLLTDVTALTEGATDD
jgi:hypothetical protein